MKTFTYVTGNMGKVEEVSRYLDIPFDHEPVHIEEIQSLDVEEVVKDKARRAYDSLKKPVLVEDVSFTISSLGKLPGPFIKWFEKELDYEGICRLLDGKNRQCVATVCYGYCDGREVRLASGSMEGTVADHPRGKNSFGWACIFIPDGLEKTYAELTKEEQEPIAMRKKALPKLKEIINQNV